MPKYDESILNTYYGFDRRKIVDQKFSKIIYFFLNYDKYCIIDNGFIYIPELYKKHFYNEIYRLSNNGTTIFSPDCVLGFTVESFFKISKIKTLNLRSSCDYDIYMSHPEIFNNIHIGEYYSTLDEPRLINERIYDLKMYLNSMKLVDYVNLIKSPVLKASLEEYIQQRRFLYILKELVQDKVLNYTDIDGVISIYFNDPIEQSDIRTYFYYYKDYLNYNKRCLFLRKAANSNLDDFFQSSKQIIKDNFNETDQNLITRMYRCYLRLPKEPNNDVSILEEIVTESQKYLYSIIKDSLFRNQNLDFSKIPEYLDVSIEQIFDYMRRRDIIAGYSYKNTYSKMFSTKDFQAFINSDGSMNAEYYYDFCYNKIYSLIKNKGSVDIEKILMSLKYFEKFEIMNVLNVYKNEFVLRGVDDFIFVSLSNLPDPFQ